MPGHYCLRRRLATCSNYVNAEALTLLSCELHRIEAGGIKDRAIYHANPRVIELHRLLVVLFDGEEVAQGLVGIPDTRRPGRNIQR